MAHHKTILFLLACVLALACFVMAGLLFTPSLATRAATDARASFVVYDKVDLNHATKEHLCTLPGIGAQKAGYIIEYRTLVGLFQTVQDVTKIQGITSEMVDEWADHVYVCLEEQ